MKMDETLYSIAEKCKNFCAIYLVDITEVPDFNKMYELYDPCTIMFFFRNKHIMIDLGTGNNSNCYGYNDGELSTAVAKVGELYVLRVQPEKLLSTAYTYSKIFLIKLIKLD